MRSEKLYLQDIIAACDAIEIFIAGLTKDVVLNNDLILSAVLRKLEIIGEASSRLSPELHSNHTEVEWNKIIGFRNILAHQYFSCDLDLTWEVAANRVGPLKNQVKAILAQMAIEEH